MPHKCEAPAGKAEATRNKLTGGSSFSSTFTRPAAQLPRLIALHIGAETLAALAFVAMTREGGAM